MSAVTPVNSPSVRLATFDIPAVHNSLSELDPTMPPALLVSYVFLDAFLKNRARYVYRNWVMDSGAFSAYNSGVKIELAAYIARCRELMASDPTLAEIFALDVIGDWKASIDNCRLMWEAGVPAIPCFHCGDPEDALRVVARDYPKIALGGMVGFSYKRKKAWLGQCFARVWPKKIHGFGLGSEDMVLAYPFHSVDATNWEIGPCAYGRWNAFGAMSVRGSKQNLRAEVEHFLKIERRAQSRWKKEMVLLEGLPDPDSPSVRLALARSRPSSSDRVADALADPDSPSVRLAVSLQNNAQATRDRIGSALGQDPDSPSVRLALQSKPVPRIEDTLSDPDLGAQ